MIIKTSTSISDYDLLIAVLSALDETQINAALSFIGWDTPLGLRLREILSETRQNSARTNKFEDVQTLLQAELSQNANIRSEFFKELLKFVDRAQMNESQVYNEIGMNRALWYRLRDNKEARTSKQNVLKLVIVLKLDYWEAFYLISLAGFSFMTSQTDYVVAFCLSRNIYDPFQVDELLEENGQNAIFYTI
jgi:predicted XRE-type DNA-binding protein